ncbi:hypothetical protein [Hydrogenophaga sp. T2]|uniref:hypothetical protein n=1 Tax=Hydrogenophaga sp. T2 TaxID=3132823 RepID=UPI003CE99516
MRLIFVHGIAQQGKDPDQLKQLWYEVLQDNLQLAGTALPANVEIGFPFYGDVLFGLTAQLAQTPPLGVKLKGSAWPSGDSERLELALELASNAGISRQQIEAQLSPMIREKGPLQWEWVHAVLSVLDQSVFMGDITLQQATAEVHAYLNYPAVSEAVDAILSAAFGGEEPCVIVAHSLGTVVTYRVLTALAGAVDVRALITLGSPLGLNTVRRKLPNPLAVPRRVRKWQNAYDDRDVVALLPLDQSRWDVQPRIENFNGVCNDTDNAHSISGYLNDRRVGSWVADALAHQA